MGLTPRARVPSHLATTRSSGLTQLPFSESTLSSTTRQLEEVSCIFPDHTRLQQLIDVVAEHFAPHTVTYPTPLPSAELFPQHADHFRRMDNPQNMDDWDMRNATELRAREMLAQAQQGYGAQ
jgi:hypothetical protein